METNGKHLSLSEAGADSGGLANKNRQEKESI